MNQLDAFLRRGLALSSSIILSKYPISFDGKDYSVVKDVEHDSATLEPGMYVHAGKRLSLLVPAEQFDLLPMIPLKAHVSFHGAIWKVAEIDKGEAAWTLFLTDPNARSS